MKIALIGFAALTLTGLTWAAPAQAQGVPQGSYLQTCSDARMEGPTLVARCRRMDGRMDRTALSDPRRCGGDIANVNGNLQCNAGGGGPRYGQAPAYGGRENIGSEGRERCGGLHREAEELRHRLDREWNPMERARTESRLREVRGQEERCR